MNTRYKELKYHISNGEAVEYRLFGAFPDCGSIRFILTGNGIISARLRIHCDGLNSPDGEVSRTFQMAEDAEGAFVVEVGIDELYSLRDTGLYYYGYLICDEAGEHYLGGERPEELLPVDEFGERQLMLYHSDFKTPSFLKRGTMYHIFVDRFKSSGRCEVKPGAVFNPDWECGIPKFPEYRGAPLDNNEFFGGDLYGVIEELDYLSSLGITVIYLSPIFESPSNHKYDTANYMKVDPMFGSDGALRELCYEAGKRGIKVLLDGVFNHTGADSVYFNKFGNYGDGGAYRSKESPYYPWYRFENWPNKYDCWWGVDILPAVNSGCSEWKEYVFSPGGVVDKWMSTGISGFRLDVADELDKTFLDEMRTAIRSFGDETAILGEVWEDASNKIAYGERREYLRGDELDSVMNYPLRGGVISFIKDGDHETLRFVLETVYRHYPKCVSDCLMNFLGTHDTERILTVLVGENGNGKSPLELSRLSLSDDEKKRGKTMLKCAYTLISFVYGIPSVFYGDEAGMEGYHDPFCRRPYPWGREESDLVDTFGRCGKLRLSEEVFSGGLFEVVGSDDNYFSFKRYDAASELLIVVTRDNDRTESFPFNVECVFDTEGTMTGEKGDFFVIPSWRGVVFKIR